MEDSECSVVGNGSLLDDQKLSPSSPLERETCQEEENPTVRTIEFLRARLLSERSVSEAARQKARQIEQKVWELERQLEIVVEQRKNAEETSQQALAMLENVSVLFESGTDEDGSAFELKSFEGVSNATSMGLTCAGEEDETSTMGSGSEKTFQNSDDSDCFGQSHRLCTGLSWQARGSSLRQYEKNAKRTFQPLEQMYLQNCHHEGVSEANAGSKRRIGKSCRQIKRRETRSVTEEESRSLTACSEDDSKKPRESSTEEFVPSEQTESVKKFCEVFERLLRKDFEGISLARHQETSYRNSLNQFAQEREEIDLRNGRIGEQTSEGDCTARLYSECSAPYSSEDQERKVESRSNKGMEMERVIEHWEELIDQYAAEENAQREWEEKFRELNRSSEQSMDILCAEIMSELDKQGGYLQSLAPCFMGLRTSDKEKATIDCVTMSSDKAAEKNIKIYSHDIGPSLTVNTIPVFEEHVPIVPHANRTLEPSVLVVHDKFLDANTVHLLAKDATERLSDNMQSTSEMVNVGSMAEAVESRKPFTERKLGTRDHDFSSSRGMMPTTDENPQEVSHGSTLMSTAQITGDNFHKKCRGYSQSWHDNCNDEQRIPLMQGLYRIGTKESAVCPSMHPVFL